jgi:hypothetical protein
MASIYRINAMKEARVGIACVMLDSRKVVFENGVKVKIRLLDEDENEVDDPEDATYYEFGDKEFGFGKAKLFHDEEEYQTEH